MPILNEIFSTFGLDVDARSFAKGQLAVEGIKVALGVMVNVARRVGNFLPSLATGTANYADNIDEASQKTGVNTTALQELAYAAKFSGLGLQDLTQSFGILSRNMLAAGQGGKEQAKAFADIGVAFQDSAGKLRSVDAVIGDVAAVFATLPDGPAKTAKAMQLFGKSGGALVPFLNAGRGGIQRLREEAQRLGVVLDETAIKQGVKTADSVDRLSATWAGLKRQIGATLLGPLASVAEGMTAWIVTNRDAIKSGISTFVAVLASTFAALKTIIGGTVDVLGFLYDQLLLVAGVMGSLLLSAVILNAKWALFLIQYYGTLAIASVMAALKSAAAWALAALPVIALGAVILGLVYIIYRFRDQVWAVIKAIGGFFADLGSEIGAGFVDAFASIREDIEGFLDWCEGKINWVINKAREVKDFFVGDVTTDMFKGAGITQEQIDTAKQTGNWDHLTAPVTPTTAEAAGAVAPSSSSSSSKSINAPATFNITTQPGQDNEAIGRVVKEKVGEFWSDRLREADAT